MQKKLKKLAAPYSSFYLFAIDLKAAPQETSNSVSIKILERTKVLKNVSQSTRRGYTFPLDEGEINVPIDTIRII